MGMEREQVVDKLHRHELELKSAGVVTLSLFGSAARGTAGTGSDVDVAVRLTDSFSAAGFDYFSRLQDLEARLSRILSCHVDLIEEPAEKQRLQQEIERDRIVVF